MENRFWTVAYRNRDNGQRITAAVFAADQQQAQKKARADGRIDGRDVWEIESIEPHEEALARVLIAEFSKKQQGRHFACPRCGKMTMDAESVTHNALSRRATVYICDACGMQEALDLAYLTLIRDHPNDRMLWDLQAVRKWGKSPATARQLEIIKKRCKGFDTANLSKGDASQILNRLLNEPKKRRGA